MSEQAQNNTPKILPSFSVVDQTIWNKIIETQRSASGARVVSYAATWANLMEAQMARGRKLKDIAKQTAEKANHDGITGAMHNSAVVLLTGVWKHGEEFRCWHNLSVRPGATGKKANAEGSVIDTSMISVR